MQQAMGESGSAIGTERVVRKATIFWEGKAHDILMEPGESLLEACLRQDIPLQHGCRAGRCGKCLGRCLSGEIRMRNGEDFRPCIPESTIAAGGVLACSSYPQTDKVCVAFDPLTKSALLPKDPETTTGGSQTRESSFDLFSSIVYGWLTISLFFPLVIEFVALPLFSLVLRVDNAVLRTCLGGGVVLVAFVLAPLVHYAEAHIFRLPARFSLLGRIPLLASARAPLLYFPAAVILWMGIEVAIAESSGTYSTPTLWEMFVFMTVLQIGNLLLMDLVFWLVHGPYGLHHRAVFRHFHAKHHRQRVSTFSTGPDLAPLDMVVEVSVFTLVPIAVGFVFGLNSMQFILCALVNSLMTSTWAHSPYRISKIVPHLSVAQYVLLIFPWLTANPHQGHHAKVECNYSIWGLWDRVFGTYQPMTEEDERIACAVHMAELERPGTYSFVYPLRSPVPYMEAGLAVATCVVLWYVIDTSGFRPQFEVLRSILPL